MPHGTRLYSIASSRYGDDFDGQTASLCVRRAVYVDPETGKEDPAKKGLCSNFLCDATPGTEISMTGPTGKVLLLPADANAPLICVATGTGIAPFRSFWRRCFIENVPSYKFTGLFWLFMGVANSDAKLYDEELQVDAGSVDLEAKERMGLTAGEGKGDCWGWLVRVVRVGVVLDRKTEIGSNSCIGSDSWEVSNGTNQQASTDTGCVARRGRNAELDGFWQWAAAAKS